MTPFGVHGNRKTSGLREVAGKAVADHPSLNLKSGLRICTQSRKKLPKRRPDLEESDIPVPVTLGGWEDDGRDDAPIPGCSGDFEFYSPESDLQELNTYLEMLGESPIKKRRPNVGKYIKRQWKLVRLSGKHWKLLWEGQWPKATMSDRRWFNNLKKKNNSTEKKSEKI